MEQDNRELTEPDGDRHGPLFEALDAPLPSQMRGAIGFISRGAKGEAIGACWTIGAAATGISARRFARHRSWADASPFAQDAEWATVAKRLIGFTTKRLSGISRLAA
jgi:hypothetical protein